VGHRAGKGGVRPRERTATATGEDFFYPIAEMNKQTLEADGTVAHYDFESSEYSIWDRLCIRSGTIERHTCPVADSAGGRADPICDVV